MIATRWKVTAVAGVAIAAAIVSWVWPTTADDDPPPTPRLQWRGETGGSDYFVPPPMAARVEGTIVHEGQPVAGARIMPTVRIGCVRDTRPTNHEVTSTADGRFTLPLTDLFANGTDLWVHAGSFQGHAVLALSDREIVRDLTIEVGVGFTVRGKLLDGSAPVNGFGSQPVSICLGGACTSPEADGSFTLHAFDLGRHRIRVRIGDSELPMTEVPPKFEIRRLSGEVDDLVLHLDGAAVRRRYESPKSYVRIDVGTIEARVATPRRVAQPLGLRCWTMHGLDEIGGGTSIPVVTRDGHTFIHCEAYVFANWGASRDWGTNIEVEVTDPDRVIDIPLVHSTPDDIDLGGELAQTPDGARIVDVADEAKAGGLQRGDLVTAIDGISVVGMNIAAVQQLGLRVPPATATTWTVLRGEHTLTIEVRAPSR